MPPLPQKTWPGPSLIAPLLQRPPESTPQTLCHHSDPRPFPPSLRSPPAPPLLRARPRPFAGPAQAPPLSHPPLRPCPRVLQGSAPSSLRLPQRAARAGSAPVHTRPSACLTRVPPPPPCTSRKAPPPCSPRPPHVVRRLRPSATGDLPAMVNLGLSRVDDAVAAKHPAPAPPSACRCSSGGSSCTPSSGMCWWPWSQARWPATG
ncbi:transmembrane protein 141 isoform X7 [Mustela putorius furo]|uniref:Transmembrane protein 141 isoform X7 n=1 Tax=Mustela putorius furo TaxID=9669 RepID=A0A8U0V3R6_MUSPF|nr:transmembrane protein 141 isoform X7 [Mustela putorius furo]